MLRNTCNDTEIDGHVTTQTHREARPDPPTKQRSCYTQQALVTVTFSVVGLGMMGWRVWVGCGEGNKLGIQNY